MAHCHLVVENTAAAVVMEKRLEEEHIAAAVEMKIEEEDNAPPVEKMEEEHNVAGVQNPVVEHNAAAEEGDNALVLEKKMGEAHNAAALYTNCELQIS